MDLCYRFNPIHFVIGQRPSVLISCITRCLLLTSMESQFQDNKIQDSHSKKYQDCPSPSLLTVARCQSTTTESDKTCASRHSTAEMRPSPCAEIDLSFL